MSNMIAEVFAEQFGGDGTRWTTPDGERFVDVARRLGAEKPIEVEEEGLHVFYYVFPDGSTIVEAGDGSGWWIDGQE